MDVGKLLVERFWLVVTVIVTIGFIVQVALTFHWIEERNDRIDQLKTEVIQQDVEIDDLKQTNDQLNGDLDLAEETIEQYRIKLGE